MHGDSLQSWLVTIVVPELSECKKAAISKGFWNEEDDQAKLLENPELSALILANMTDLAKANKFSGLEKIKKIHLTSEPFTIENDILTPTMKIKRNIAKNVYSEQIAEMYAN